MGGSDSANNSIPARRAKDSVLRLRQSVSGRSVAGFQGQALGPQGEDREMQGRDPVPGEVWITGLDSAE